MVDVKAYWVAVAYSVGPMGVLKQVVAGLHRETSHAANTDIPEVLSYPAVDFAKVEVRFKKG